MSVSAWRPPIACLAALGEPQDESPRVVLVAGTNGKGSTAALAGKHGDGCRLPHWTVHISSSGVGRGASAHRWPGDTDEQLASTVAEVVPTAESRLGYLPTYFEALTASACLWFAQESVDLAVLEVGLGGRLDATNGMRSGALADHRDRARAPAVSGQDPGEHRREKRPGSCARSPAIAWVERPEASDIAIQAGSRRDRSKSGPWGLGCGDISAERSSAGRSQQVELSTPAGRQQVTLPLLGDHQVANLALADAWQRSNSRRQGLDRVERRMR